MKVYKVRLKGTEEYVKTSSLLEFSPRGRRWESKPTKGDLSYKLQQYNARHEKKYSFSDFEIIEFECVPTGNALDFD